LTITLFFYFSRTILGIIYLIVLKVFSCICKRFFWIFVILIFKIYIHRKLNFKIFSYFIILCTYWVTFILFLFWNFVKILQNIFWILSIDLFMNIFKQACIALCYYKFLVFMACQVHFDFDSIHSTFINFCL